MNLCHWIRWMFITSRSEKFFQSPFSLLNCRDSSCGISLCCYENSQIIKIFKGTFVQDRQTCWSVGPVRDVRLCMARLVRQRHPETSILVSEQGYTSFSLIMTKQKRKNRTDDNTKQLNMVMPGASDFDLLSFYKIINIHRITYYNTILRGKKLTSMLVWIP